ncbi:MAG: hypothetical protein KDB53_11335 [Planctomycetes bacterium]|nr:hypothetical protein [Planctomycetota bacterium]
MKGYHLQDRRTAWLHTEGSPQRELEVEAIRERPWPAEFKVLTHQKSGKVTNRRAVEPALRVRAPADPGLVGQTVTISVGGAVHYPDVRSFETESSLKRGDEAREAFKMTRDFELLAKGDLPRNVEADGSSRKQLTWHARVATSALGLSFILVILGLIIRVVKGVINR